MSSPRTETAVRPTPDQPKKTSLSAAQVAASALAAVSSAVVASFFGVAGTLIGAALASVITTVSASLYATSLKKTNERLRQVIRNGPRRPAAGTATRELPTHTLPTRALPTRLDPRRTPPRPIRPRWGRVAVYAVSDRAELDQLLADDPYTLEAIAAGRTIHEWKITLGPWAASQ